VNHYPTIKEVHKEMIGGYVSKRFKHHTFSFGWDFHLATEVTSINPDRAKKRVLSYVDNEELDRVRPRVLAGKDFSIRFGVEKTGAGNFGDRGDFCLLGAAYSKKVLTLHYRSLELFGGLVYDQAILLRVISYLQIEVTRVVVMASSCHSFALKGNSNQKLFEKLEVIYGTSNAGSDVNANGPRRRPKRNV
jgi:hypothetical protein